MGDVKRLITFENHRTDKIPASQLISVITKKNTVESGWTNGRDLDEIKKDFGEENRNWFWFYCQAAAYLVKNGMKPI